MKYITNLILAIISFLAISMPASHAEERNGTFLYRICHDINSALACVSYVNGFIDAYHFSTPLNERIFCLPKNISDKDIGFLFWSAANKPELKLREMNPPAEGIVITILSMMYPCSR